MVNTATPLSKHFCVLANIAIDGSLAQKEGPLLAQRPSSSLNFRL